jgi:DNA-binding NtrC family response regulator
MARETATVLSAALICPNPSLLSTFQAVCASVRELGAITEVPEYPVASELERLFAQNRIEAVFIDVGSDRSTALQIIAAVGRFAPHVAIAGLDQRNNPEAILQCLRGGAAEFLASPFPVEEVRHAVRRMLEHSGFAARRPVSARGEIHVFAPVKGGSGATTIAYTSAY